MGLKPNDPDALEQVTHSEPEQSAEAGLTGVQVRSPVVAEPLVAVSSDPESPDSASHTADKDAESVTAPELSSLQSNSASISGNSMSSSVPMNPAPTPSNAQRPGERLRQARLLQQREVKEIANELRIPERLIVAIEADDYKSLPEPAFVRGYLRSYARLLGVDSDILITQFNEIYTSATGLSSNHSLENSPIQQLAKLQSKAPRSRRWMWWVAIPVVLVVLVLILKPILSKIMKSGPEEHSNRNIVLGNGTDGQPATEGNTIPMSSAPPLSSLSTPTAPVTNTITSGSSSSADQLVLTLSKSSDVTVQDSTGKTLVSGTQGTGQPLTLSGTSPFSITLSDAADVSLSLNGEHVDLKPYTVDGRASFRLSR